jgi:hypothetical protein
MKSKLGGRWLWCRNHLPGHWQIYILVARQNNWCQARSGIMRLEEHQLKWTVALKRRQSILAMSKMIARQNFVSDVGPHVDLCFACSSWVRNGNRSSFELKKWRVGRNRIMMGPCRQAKRCTRNCGRIIVPIPINNLLARGEAIREC